jgi:hypothetical protein
MTSDNKKAKKCKQVSWDDDGGNINGVVVRECMSTNPGSTKSPDKVKEITYTDVVDYLTYIVKTYEYAMKAIQGKDIKDIKEILQKFAKAQDSIYARKYKESGDGHLADDLFEVILATQNKYVFNSGEYNDDERRNEIMHDAWTLGKMFIIAANGIVNLQSNENGTLLEQQEIIITDEQEFEKAKKDNADGKRLVSIQIKNNDVNKPFIFTFQWRRIFTDKQLVKFEKLSHDQQVLDNPPQFTYYAIITPEDQTIIEKFISVNSMFPPEAMTPAFMTANNFGGGGKRKNTMKDSGKRITMAGTSGKRILFIGDRGKKYIKKGGEYVALNKKKYTYV